VSERVYNLQTAILAMKCLSDLARKVRVLCHYVHVEVSRHYVHVEASRSAIFNREE